MTTTAPPTSTPTGEAEPAATPSPTTALSDRPSERVLALERMSLAELEGVFVRGTPPTLDRLVGWEFRGLNSPPWFKLLGIKKFIKGFFAGDDGEVWGYNLPVHQDRITAPWRPRPDQASAKRFGFYRVVPVDPTARDNRYLHAALLDYGRGKNPRFDPSAGLRDYLVQVDADNPDIYLGKAYYAVGPARLPTFSFFILERFRPGPERIERGARR